MTKRQIRRALSNIDDVCVEKKTEKCIYIWDELEDKILPLRFEEKFTLESLKEAMYLSPKLASIIGFNEVATYLYSLDKNLFTTLEKLCFMWNEDDYNWLYNETGDEYALYVIDENELGKMWFERNICIVDVKNIVKTCLDLAGPDVDINDTENYFMERQYFIEDLNSGIIMTAIHELRHLMLDTNIILPEDEYPINLSDEDLVEQYCNDIWDENRCWCLKDNVSDINFLIDDFSEV